MLAFESMSCSHEHKDPEDPEGVLCTVPDHLRVTWKPEEFVLKKGDPPLVLSSSQLCSVRQPVIFSGPPSWCTMSPSLQHMMGACRTAEHQTHTDDQQGDGGSSTPLVFAIRLDTALPSASSGSSMHSSLPPWHMACNTPHQQQATQLPCSRQALRASAEQSAHADSNHGDAGRSSLMMGLDTIIAPAAATHQQLASSIQPHWGKGTCASRKIQLVYYYDGLGTHYFQQCSAKHQPCSGQCMDANIGHAAAAQAACAAVP